MSQFKTAICKFWHWNLGIGIGIGTMSTSIRPIKPEPSRVRLKMRVPHPQSHLTHMPWGYVTKQKHHISLFTTPMAPKTWHGADSGWSGSTQKVTQHFYPVVVTWQFKNVIFPQPQALWPPNLARWVLRLKNRHAQSNGSISWLQRRYIFTFIWHMVGGTGKGWKNST